MGRGEGNPETRVRGYGLCEEGRVRGKGEILQAGGKWVMELKLGHEGRNEDCEAGIRLRLVLEPTSMDCPAQCPA